MKKASKMSGNKNRLRSVSENLDIVLGSGYFKPQKNFNYCTMRTANGVREVKPAYEVSYRIITTGKS